jgi:hypothetical protein
MHDAKRYSPAKCLNHLKNASGTNIAMLLDVRDQCTSPKETPMSQSDQKENQNPPMKAPSPNPSNPSSPSAKPAGKEDDHKTGTDKPAVKADEPKTSGDSKR